MGGNGTWELNAVKGTGTAVIHVVVHLIRLEGARLAIDEHHLAGVGAQVVEVLGEEVNLGQGRGRGSRQPLR